jgi:cell wall-associated NlpC family hydrolase
MLTALALRLSRSMKIAGSSILVLGMLFAGQLAAVTPAHASPLETAQAAAEAAREASITGNAEAARGARIAGNALDLVGYRYRFGGSSPRTGFDCSGFVYYVMQSAGISVGRTAAAQFNSGTRVSTDNLQPGDMVFFSNTYKRGLSHAGIYIGNGKFVHAENESTGVRVSNLWSAYYASHYTGAVRP